MSASIRWNPTLETEVDTLSQAVGDLVREHRRRTGLPLATYARAYGVSREVVNAAECGRRANFTLTILAQLLDNAGYRLVIAPKESP